MSSPAALWYLKYGFATSQDKHAYGGHVGQYAYNCHKIAIGELAVNFPAMMERKVLSSIKIRENKYLLLRPTQGDLGAEKTRDHVQT